MRVIAISNRKGGTGKTTVAVNLAAELAASGRRVLLVDLDSQGHCAVGLGVTVDPGKPAAHRIFTDPDARLLDAVLPTAFENLFLAPADQLFEHGSGLREDDRLARALGDPVLTERFDTVIIDTPPSLDILLFNALNAADWVLVPYVPHHLSFEGVQQLVRVLFKVMSKSNRRLRILGFLPMMSAEHIRQHRTITGDMSRQFGAHRLLPCIRTDIRLAESFAAGQPIRIYAPKSRGAEDFAALGRVVAYE
jgi:chromosome partitioning protein